MKPLKTLIVAAAFVLTAGFAANASSAGQAPATAAKTAPAMNPTQTRAEPVLEYVEWVFDIALTAAEEAELRAQLEQPAGKESPLVQELVASQKDLVNHSEDDRRELRPSVEDELVKSLKRRYAKDPVGQLIHQVREMGTKPIAKGNPPLVRQSTDALAEATAFAVREAKMGELSTDKAFRDAFARALASDFKGFSDEQKIALMDLPRAWKAARQAWPTMPEAKKEELRKQWREAFTALKLEGDAKAMAADSKALRDAAKGLAAQVATWSL